MTPEAKASFEEHIEKLAVLAINCHDEDRMMDARRSLCCMVLLRASEDHPDYAGGMTKLIEAAVLRVSGLPPESELH